MGDDVPENKKKQHIVCIPYPAQGHINPMIKLAKLLLHRQDFHITFVNTEYNHRRLVNSRGPSAVAGHPRFRFATIPDGLPYTDADSTQDIPSLCLSTTTTCLEPFCELIERLNGGEGDGDFPPVTCILSDGAMSFTLRAAERFNLPELLFWTTSACGLLAYTQYKNLVDKGYVPLKDMSQVTDGYLDTAIDWIPGMKDIKLKDFPSFIRTTDREDIMLNFIMQETEAIPRGKALILNTFDALERDAVSTLSSTFPRVLTVGPLQLMARTHDGDEGLRRVTSSLWKEDVGCAEWLDAKEPGSVVYVNFGSITVVTAHQMAEFAWGLADSKRPFLWVVRPDLVAGDTAILPANFMAETKDRSLMVNWCDQEEVLEHRAIGGFLTHSGWNSTLESVGGGVPVMCWPFFAEQQTNCRYSCVEWGFGTEIGGVGLRRDEVEKAVNELMGGGAKGKEMREKAAYWKGKAYEAAEVGGSSYLNFDRLIREVMILK